VFSPLERLFRSARPGHRTPGRRRTGLEVQPLEGRQLLTAISDQGPIIPNVQLEAVFYGAEWNDTLNKYSPEVLAQEDVLDNFLPALMSSHYLDGLKQYTATDAHGVVTAPGAGTYLGSVIVHTPLGTHVDDGAVRAMLTAEIANHAVPAPRNGNTLYLVFMPPDTIDSADGSYGSHHSVLNTPQGPAYFATIANPITQYPPPPGSFGGETHFQTLTAVTSSVLVGAITDPDGTGWHEKFTRSEVEYITVNNPSPGGALGMVDGYTVQKYWSNADRTSIIPGGTNLQPWASLPDVSVTMFTLHAVEDGRWTSIPVEIGRRVTNSVVGTPTYTAYWGPRNRPALAFLSVDGVSDKIDVTIRGTDFSLLFDGEISSPDNTWHNWNYYGGHAVMSGTIYPQGYGSEWFYAFGWQDDDNLRPPTGEGGGGGSEGGTPPGWHGHALE
jgi:hypothetical protein